MKITVEAFDYDATSVSIIRDRTEVDKGAIEFLEIWLDNNITLDLSLATSRALYKRLEEFYGGTER